MNPAGLLVYSVFRAAENGPVAVGTKQRFESFSEPPPAASCLLPPTFGKSVGSAASMHVALSRPRLFLNTFALIPSGAFRKDPTT